jgi:glycosyltransferase involved in cell wall biosynthesis
MWPGPDDPDFGSFLVPIVRELERLGHEVELVAITRRAGGPRRHLRLALDTIRAARRTRPDVVFAHMLFPAGLGALVGARLAGAPVVVMAHGQDVANLDRPPLRAATAPVLRWADALIANSRWLAARIPRPPDAVIDCGIDLDAFRPRPRGDGPAPHFLCIGSLTERKNVIALADAFARLGEGRLTFLGDGPLRPALEGRANVELPGRVPHAEVPAWIARADAERGVRPGDAGGDGDGAHRRRDDPRRPAGVRDTAGRGARRPAGPGRAGRGAARGRGTRDAARRRAGRGRRA